MIRGARADSGATQLEPLATPPPPWSPVASAFPATLRANSLALVIATIESKPELPAGAAEDAWTGTIVESENTSVLPVLLLSVAAAALIVVIGCCFWSLFDSVTGVTSFSATIKYTFLPVQFRKRLPVRTKKPKSYDI